MIRRMLLLALAIAGFGLQTEARDTVLRARTPIRFPDLPGYVTLKCDFHIHTVFSDGLVWPTVRVEEAWREGLDAIAITDHIEYQPYKADVSTNHNRASEVALAAGADLGILVIRGSEITRVMPPGHFNAIFLTNANALAVSNWFDALEAARQQGAFILWNHPGWEPQLIGGKVQWLPEHTRIFDAGMMHGIELVNECDYYPEAHRWAIEKNLTVFGNTDIHPPIGTDYNFAAGEHRTMTLVFARERTVDSIKEALFDRRTAVFSSGRVLGEERFLTSLFNQSVRVLNSPARRDKAFIQVHNDSSVDWLLERTGDAPVSIPRKVTLWAQKTSLIEVRGLGKLSREKKEIDLSWRVMNLLTAPEQPLQVTLQVSLPDSGTSR